jgi:AP endonuclease-1
MALSRHVLPHGSYLVNLAQDEPAKAKQTYDAFVDDLKRCEALGIKLYNFHPGTTGPRPRPEAISRIAAALNRAHKETSTVKPLLENMAGKGNVIGATFEDLHDIIEEVEDKSRIGVCIDTCHSFAAGYDLRSPEAFKKTLQKFDEVVGMKYLSALHINDSKAPFASHRDLHQNIGLGFLGLKAFHNVMNEPRFEGLPLVLETPIEKKDDNGKVIEDKSIWAMEIKLLESLIGMDPESDEFKTLERDLAAKGAEERAKHQEAFDRKLEKERKAIGKGKPRDKNQGSIAAFLKKKKKKGEESDDSQSSLGDISD